MKNFLGGTFVVLIIGISVIAISDEIEAETVSDSFTFIGTPYWLGSGVGIGSAAVVTRGGVPNILVLEDKPAYKYLKDLAHICSLQLCLLLGSLLIVSKDI